MEALFTALALLIAIAVFAAAGFFLYWLGRRDEREQQERRDRE